MAIADNDFVMLVQPLVPFVLYHTEPPVLGQVEDAAPATIVAWEDGRRVAYGVDLSAADRFEIVAASAANADLLNALVRPIDASALFNNFNQEQQGVVVRSFSAENPSDALVADVVTIKTKLGFITMLAADVERVPDGEAS